jgi:GNAT superfamily N-acetyltransferase
MAMVNAFRSKSLVYRAVEDNEEDKAFLHSLWLDPQLYYQNNYRGLHQPISRKFCDSLHEFYKSQRLIDVLICLPIDSEELEVQNKLNHSLKKSIPIGSINLHGATNHNRHHRTLDISIFIATEYQGQGYGSEAIRWILNWGFQMAGLHRIGLQSASFNTRAIKLWERLGFQKDGNLREAVWINGKWHDEVIFSILEDEWRAMLEEKHESDSSVSQ